MKKQIALSLLGLLLLTSTYQGYALSAVSDNESFVGEWNGTAGDQRVDEQWRISHVNGKWAVFGYYFWNEKGVADNQKRTAGDLAGRFKGVNVKVEDGTLKFTQTFDEKPIGDWADTTNIEAQVKGDTITFKNQYVSDVKLKRDRH